MLVDVEDPIDVDVAEPAPSLVEVLVAIEVDVDDEEEEDRSSSLVEVVPTLAVVAVVSSGTVAPVVGDVSSTDVTVAPVELVEAPALVTDVDVPSSLPAQATPTTASAATTDVTNASIFFIIYCLLGWTWCHFA